ncbi:MAG: zinc ribbon domain-containing protein [Desulfovibrionaceae bacterium]|nr:zinc ribbon domain-containing protein [Desulfovibrionaceae bacterium]
MPIYEYQCPKCQHIFEEWVKVADAHGMEPCPECGTSSPRLISHTSFVLKGGGWYVTDYGYRKGIKEEQSTATSTKKQDSTQASKDSTSAKQESSKASTETTSAPKLKPHTTTAQAS